MPYVPNEHTESMLDGWRQFHVLGASPTDKGKHAECAADEHERY